MKVLEPWENLQLDIPEDIHDQMVREGIWVENIQKVIYHALQKNEYVFDPSSGCCVASLKQNYATFWVSFLEVNNIYVVKKVYYHRMEINWGEL